MKRGLRVWTRTIIGGLVVLLMVAVAGCADAEPKSTGVPRVPTSAQVATPSPSLTAPPSPTPADATDVEVVCASPAYPLPWDQGDYDPLWGDLDADAPIIDRLLRAIAGGTPVEIMEIDEERTWTPYSSLIMNLRFRNGTTWSVRTAIRCDITSEGRKEDEMPACAGPLGAAPPQRGGRVDGADGVVRARRRIHAQCRTLRRARPDTPG